MGVETRTVVVCDLCGGEAAAPPATKLDKGDYALPDGWSMLVLSRFDIENDIICEDCSEKLLAAIRQCRARGGKLPKAGGPDYVPGFGPTNGSPRLAPMHKEESGGKDS